MFGERGHRGIEKRSADVELDVLGTLRFERHTSLTRHHDAAAATDAAADAAVQIPATSPDAAAAAATDAPNVQHPLLHGEGMQRGKGPLYQGGKVRLTYLECFCTGVFMCAIS